MIETLVGTSGKDKIVEQAVLGIVPTQTKKGIGGGEAIQTSKPTVALPEISSPTSAPNWNSLTVGQKLNGGSVLDAAAFDDIYLNEMLEGGNKASLYRAKAGKEADNIEEFMFEGFSGKSGHDDAKKLGANLGQDAKVQLAGWKSQNFGTNASLSNGDGGQGTAESWDTDALQREAKKAGLKYEDYITKGTVGATEEGIQTVTPDKVRGLELQNEINRINFQKAAKDPNAVFLADSQRVGTSTYRNRLATVYVRRGDRLVPVQATEYTRDSELKDSAKGAAPVVAIVASAFLGPWVSAYFGGGIGGAAAAGAATGAVNSAITGQNVLKGALMGGVTAGLGAGAGQAATALGASKDVARIASGVTRAGVGGLARGESGSSLTQSLLTGGLTSANFGGMAGLDPSSAKFLNTVIGTGLGQVKKKGKP